MIQFQNTDINYKVIGNGEKVVVYLHGWGANLQSLSCVANYINAKNILIDFPPFGESGEISGVWNLDDYVSLISCILEREKVKNFSLICHSFGARVGIKLANLYNENVEKLIITGGAGLKSRNKIKKTFRKLKYRVIKMFNKNAQVGSKDYISLSPNMKKTFNNIINEDLSKECKKLNVKTLLIYGSKDKETPLYMAKKFNKLIKNSKLVIYKNCGHFAYLQNLDNFILQTQIFLKE